VLDVLINMILDLIGGVLGQLSPQVAGWLLIALAVVIAIAILILWQIAFG
jgi:hypothetical protein